MTPVSDPVRVDGAVLVHGAGSDVDDSFGATADALAEHLPVVRHHLPGSGGRAVVDPLDLDEVAWEVVAAVRDAGLGRCALVGSSTGSAVAVRAAILAPDAVAALVLTVGFARADTSMRLALGLWRSLLDHPDPEVVGSYLTLVGTSSRWQRETSPDDVAAVARSIPPALPDGTRAQLDLALSLDVSGDLPSVAAPTLVLSGQDDRLVPPWLSDEVADGIPGAVHRTLPSGHAWADEAPEAWLAVVRDLLGLAGP